jgi:hypothetical protein
VSTAFPITDKETALSLIRGALPEWEWFVAHLESRGGLFRFPSIVSDAIRNLRIESYPLLYENEKAIGAIILRAVLPEDELKALEGELIAATAKERGSLLRELLESLDELGDVHFEIPKTPAAVRRAQEAFDALSAEERKDLVRSAQFLWSGFLAVFHQQLSIIVHGEKLTSLVAQAGRGDRTAFAKAVQIDKAVLQQVPYFREGYATAGRESDMPFLREIGARIAAPPYRGRIRHKSLYLTFAALEGFGLLDDFAHGELLDFCEEAGVGAHRARIEDVKNLSKRLAEYRRFQQRGFESTP